MKSPAELRAAALELAASFELSEAETRERLERVRTPDYWRGLSDAIQISPAGVVEDIVLAADEQREIERHFDQERYFKTPVLLRAPALSRMNAAIDAVRAAGWPPLFALVSDDFWQCSRLPAIRQVLAARLGQGYRQIPHFWVHIVRNIDGAAGWLPHFDGLRERRVSVWVALTEATAENGCIFLVPPNLLPASFRTLEFGTLPTMDVARAMHATRPLPVPAGAALGWDFDVFHWGGRATAPKFERRALSMEFLSADQPPLPDEHPMLSADGPLPTFTERLRVIGIGLDQYAKREPTAQRFRGLAQDLMIGPTIP